MANTIVITKLTNGSIEVVTTGQQSYTLPGDMQLKKNEGFVSLYKAASFNSTVEKWYPEDVEKVVSDAGGEVLISDVDTLYSELKTNFFFKASTGGGGSIPNPDPTGEGELISVEGVVQWDTRPYSVDDGTDNARFKGDVYADGEYFAQQNSTIYANNIKVGVTGNKLVITDVETGKQSLIARNEIDSGASTGTKDIFRYAPFTKSDPLGQLQPDDSLTFNSTSFVEDLTGDTKYYYQVTLPASNQLVTDIWYFRSLTGLDNSYIYVYKGVVDFSTLTGQQDTKCWSTNTPKEIRTKTNLVNDAGGSGVDIEYKLGNTFFEEPGDLFTYVFVCDNNFTTQGQTYTGVDIPYIKGDGAKWGVVNTSSELIVNGNLSLNEFNGNLQLNSSNTEYYGCNTILKSGVYDKVEIPYKNRVTTQAPAYLYFILLDQNDNTIAYKRLYVGTGGSSEGVFTLNLDEELLVETTEVYQVVIGRRKWNGNNRRVDLFHKDINNSNGAVWIAWGNQNSQLNQDDTSGANWSTVNKQNFNRIPKALIYKF
tara:strand:+ start:711 stop:2324 length:1614 start_codon:yes stop_codon:yes gene_type:complete